MPAIDPWQRTLRTLQRARLLMITAASATLGLFVTLDLPWKPLTPAQHDFQILFYAVVAFPFAGALAAAWVLDHAFLREHLGHQTRTDEALLEDLLAHLRTRSLVGMSLALVGAVFCALAYEIFGGDHWLVGSLLGIVMLSALAPSRRAAVRWIQGATAKLRQRG